MRASAPTRRRQSTLRLLPAEADTVLDADRRDAALVADAAAAAFLIAPGRAYRAAGARFGGASVHRRAARGGTA